MEILPVCTSNADVYISYTYIYKLEFTMTTSTIVCIIAVLHIHSQQRCTIYIYICMHHAIQQECLRKQNEHVVNYWCCGSGINIMQSLHYSIHYTAHNVLSKKSGIYWQWWGLTIKNTSLGSSSRQLYESMINTTQTTVIFFLLP